MTKLRLSLFAALAVTLFPAISSAQFTDDGGRADEPLETSANWTKDGGVGGSEMQVLSNQFALDNAAGARRAYIAPNQGTANMYAQAALAGTLGDRGSSTNVQVAIRYQDQDNYIGIGVSSSGNMDCGERVATTWTSYFTDIDVAAVSVKIVADGTSIECWRDVGAGFVLEHTESPVTQFQTETDGAFISNLNLPDTAVWDDFEIGGLAAPDAFTDDFNRADEILDDDANWTRQNAGGQEVSIVSNSLETSDTLSARRMYFPPDNGVANMYVQADIVTLTGRPANTQGQIVLRAADRDNYIGCGVSPAGNIGCGTRIAGTYATFYNETQASVTDIRLEAQGTEVRVYYDIGAGFVLAHTETGVTAGETNTDGGVMANSGTAGQPLFDDFEMGSLSAPPVGDWVAVIEDHFTFDPEAFGTTYYFNSDRSGGSGTGVSDTNAFYTCQQIDAKNFTAGDSLRAIEDQATTCNAKIKNDSMVGDGIGHPFYVGAYHLVGSVETPGLSGGPYSNTPGGRPCFDGIDYDTYSYYAGDMTNAEVMSMLPTPNGGATFSSGSLEGLWNWYQNADYDLDLMVEDICVRATGGRAFRFTQSGTAQAEWLYANNLYMEGTSTQAFHVSGVYNFIVENTWVTMTDFEKKYSPSTSGNTQACMAFKGTQGDPDREVNGVFRKNAIWDSVCSEGVQSNSGGNHILIEDNVIVDAGHVAGIYLDRTNDMTVRRNFLIHTEGREEFENNTSSNPRGWAGIMVQNEQSCGSFDWCNTYDQPEDFAAYATQRAVISENIVMGWRFNYSFQSQASGISPNTHLAEDHGAGIYWYNNMSLDADERHFTINNAAPESNYSLRTDIAQRVWGNIFYNSAVGGGDGVGTERDDTQFVSVFDNNYYSNDITVKASYDQNIIQTGLVMPLSTYYNMDTYMTWDADKHMDYDDFRTFLSVIGFSPDDLTDKSLNFFRPTSNVSSSVLLSAQTFPPGNDSGVQQNIDIEGNLMAEDLLFGPFAEPASASEIYITLQQLIDGFGADKSQGLSGVLDQ